MTYLNQSISGLYGSEKGRLSRLVKRIVGNGHTADELVQDAFFKLVDASRKRQIDEPRAYLTRAARNLALNHLRHLRQGVEVGIDEQLYNAVADRRASPEVELLYRQELRRLLEALTALPPRRREIFILHRFEGASYSEIATRLELSRRTVINHVFNALSDLDDALGADFLSFP